MLHRAFDSLRRRLRRKRYQRLSSTMRIEALAGFIVDLGGGPASFFAAMFPRSEQVILVDIDYNRAQRAKRKRPALRVIVADGERIPLADRSVDLTVCNSVIEHGDDPDALVAEIRCVSRSTFVQTLNGGFPLEAHSFIGYTFL